MRIDLTTTYPERHEAKALGARWDVSKRVWYVIDPQDLTPFLRWIATEKLQSGSSVVPTDPASQLRRNSFLPYSAVPTELDKSEGPAELANQTLNVHLSTAPKVQPLHSNKCALGALLTNTQAQVARFNSRKRITGPAYVPHCGCDVLPWDHCAHTKPTEIAGNLQ